MCRFSQMHTHTGKSLFDGVPTVDQIFNKAKRSGMQAVAITDHHNVFAWFEMEEAAQKHNVKPIFGIELNVDKHHITALALNEEGLKNVIQLNNIGYQKGGSRPKVTERELFENQEGIFFLSGCLNGKIPNLLFNKKVSEALDAVDVYQKVFGDRFALEVQNYDDDKHKKLIKALVYIAKRKNTIIVPTNDCHYLDENDYPFHQRLVSMNAQGKIVPCNNQNYFKTVEEMKFLFPEQILEETEKIVQRVNTNFEEYIQKQKGDKEIPIGMFFYYDDAESLRKALYARKEYALAEFMYKKMKREERTLEDLYQNGSLKNDIEFAYGLRGKLYKVEPDPHHFIKANENFPIYRKSREADYCTQSDIFTVQKLGFEVFDKRKSKLISLHAHA